MDVYGDIGEKVWVRVKFDSFASNYVNGIPVPPVSLIVSFTP